MKKEQTKCSDCGESETEQVRVYVRQDFRDLAKEAVRRVLPKARFYR